MAAYEDYQSDWCYLFPKLGFKGNIRTEPHDFMVEEVLTFEPEGEGEHFFLWVEKTGANTSWVAKQLALFAGVRVVDVGYAGLKDRHAITRQWFSIHLPGVKCLPIEKFECQGVQILKATKHRKKLKRGTVLENRFDITIRALEADSDILNNRLTQISQHGVPNYFTEQRFGHSGNNFIQGARFILGEIRVKNRDKRSIYLSAIRSYLFNHFLSVQLELNEWQSVNIGNALIFDGRNQLIPVTEESLNNLQERVIAQTLHQTGPLWGQGKSILADEVFVKELDLLNAFQPLLAGLEGKGLKMERRALRMVPKGLQYQLSQNELNIRFSLASGQYALAVLRELLDIQDVSKPIQ